MAQFGKVLVIEPIVAEGNEPGVSKSLDMTMRVMRAAGACGPKTNIALFDAAGLVLTRIIPTPSQLRLIEGTRRD